MLFACSLQTFTSRTKTHHTTGCPRQRKRSLPSSMSNAPGTSAQNCLLISSKMPVTSTKCSPKAMESTDAPPQDWLTQSLALPEHSNLSCTAAARNILPGRTEAAAREPEKWQREVVGLRRRQPRWQEFHRARRAAKGKVQAEPQPANAPRRAGERQILTRKIHFPAWLGLINCIFWT